MPPVRKICGETFAGPLNATVPPHAFVYLLPQDINIGW